MADDELVDADVVVPADDWLCAANSALMVAGDSCENPVDPEAGVELAEAGALPSNSAALSPNPVEATDDNELDEVSDWTASSAADAAPRANSMERTSTEAARRGLSLPPRSISKPRAIAKRPTKPEVFTRRMVRRPRQLMPSRQNFPPAKP